MSLIFCDHCQFNVDTDFDTDGIYPGVDHGGTAPDFICGSCIERMTALDLKKLGYDYDTLGPLSGAAATP